MPALYKKYEDATLKKLQNLELEILKDFDELCQRNNIDYFGCGGTAIGAVRHQGFIPWDDDIDVALLRPDYDRFLQYAEEELGDKYYLLNTKNDHSYPLMTTRMVLRGTRFQEECFKDLNCNFGIFLDIYCFDYIPDDERQMKREAIKVWIKGKLMILCAIGKPVLYMKGIKAGLVTVMCECVHVLFKLFHVTPYVFYKSIQKDLMKNNSPSCRVAYQFDPQLYTSIVDVEDIFPTRKMEFSGLKIRMPLKINAYLEKRYGDYMTLPPEEKRHNHPPFYLNFGGF